MIGVYGTYFKIDTKNTSFVLEAENGFVYQRYYGKKLKHSGDFSVLAPDFCGDAVKQQMRDNYSLSFSGSGDMREPLAVLRNRFGSYINRFLLIDAQITEGHYRPHFPVSREKSATLELHFKDSATGLELTQYYSCFEDCDIIAASCALYNASDESVTIARLMSLQLDLCGQDYYFRTFTGAWASERLETRHEIVNGIYVNDSKTGSSSAYRNPYTVLEKRDGSEAIAFNLIYSGSHKELVDAFSYGNIRFLAGINDHEFECLLPSGETFETPEAIMAWAPSLSEVTSQMHTFVNRHVINPRWRERERPVVFNNWEATYFDFTQKKLLELADIARDVGIELFVLDDGWFGERNKDDRSLGDWYEDKSKLPQGLADFSARLKERGLKFGLWFEPEMISEQSDLYRLHPEFVMKDSIHTPLKSRNQWMLDLVNPSVQQYIINSVSSAIRTYHVDYIKWDYNRDMTDRFSDFVANTGEYGYRYICGLYRIWETLTDTFPDVLFESCASGGSRYDLGVLYYMPQIWTSDNTDARERLYIQEGTLCGYPQSTMSAHVSACPNHQTANTNSLEDRFNVACNGLLGYELDLSKLTDEERKTIASQIAFYKGNRSLLQNGRYELLTSAYGNDFTGWIVVSPDREKAVAFLCRVNHLFRQTNPNGIIKFKGLQEEYHYLLVSREQNNSCAEISFEADGDLLQNAGINLGKYLWNTDRNENSNSILSRILYIKRI